MAFDFKGTVRSSENGVTNAVPVPLKSNAINS
jgi:hypothetical protein